MFKVKVTYLRDGLDSFNGEFGPFDKRDMAENCVLSMCGCQEDHWAVLSAVIEVLPPDKPLV